MKYKENSNSLKLVPINNTGDTELTELISILECIEVVREKFISDPNKETFEHLLDTYRLIGNQTPKIINTLKELETYLYVFDKAA